MRACSFTQAGSTGQLGHLLVRIRALGLLNGCGSLKVAKSEDVVRFGRIWITLSSRVCGHRYVAPERTSLRVASGRSTFGNLVLVDFLSLIFFIIFSSMSSLTMDSAGYHHFLSN